jgi:hypothetical protein
LGTYPEKRKFREISKAKRKKNEFEMEFEREKGKSNHFLEF